MATDDSVGRNDDCTKDDRAVAEVQTVDARLEFAVVSALEGTKVAFDNRGRSISDSVIAPLLGGICDTLLEGLCPRPRHQTLP
jgi:hypothetical protein